MAPRVFIKPPRREPSISINEAWRDILEPAINQIYGSKGTHNDERLSFKVLYDTTYRLVTQGHGRTLHRKFVEATHAYLMSISLPIYNNNGSEEDSSSAVNSRLLEMISQLWEIFQLSLKLIGDIFMYLDRSLTGDSAIPSTKQVGHRLFREDVIDKGLDDIFKQMLAEIEKERKSLVVNAQVLKTIVDMLKSLRVEDGENCTTIYDTKFRSYLIDDTIRVYKQSLNEIQKLSAVEKLKRIELWLTSEAKLGLLYLPDVTRQDLVKSLETEVVDQALSAIFLESEKSVGPWVKNDDFEALALASQLETRCESRNLVTQIGKELGKDQQLVNKSQSDPLAWVSETIKLREKYIKISQAVGQDAWESTLMPIHQNSIGESPEASYRLAQYLDEHLKKNANIAIELVEPALDNAQLLYNSLSDRDEFALIFQRLLARRLLNNSSRSREHEYSWLRRMKDENLSADSLTYERMIINIDESRRLFHGSESIAPGCLPMSVNVLSRHLWPKSMLPQAKYTPMLPPDIADAQEKFEDFYKTVKRDRILTWNYGLSNADVKIRVGDRTYLASVPTMCMSILSLFEGDESYTAEQISEKTNIPLDGELERHLKSLYAAPGSQLLIKTPPGKEVEKGDVFRFNTEFTSPKSRFKIKKVSATKAPARSKATSEDADFLARERVQKTEAAIIRILKSRKQLSHNTLLEQAASNLSNQFVAAPSLVKIAIQNLLGREYIVRKDDDAEIYEYAA